MMRRSAFDRLIGLIFLLPFLMAIVLASRALSSPDPQIVFTDEASTSGIRFILDNSATKEKHQPETMIGGVAVFDYNNDGWPDLYFVNGAHLPDMNKDDPKYWNRLYRNNRDGTFTDVTEEAGVRGRGYGMGVATADYNNDGCVDIYIAGVNYNQLLRNNCDGTFTDVTERAGVGGVSPTLGKLFSVGAGWFDFDNDGLLDLFVVNYVQWDLQHEPACQSSGQRSYCTPLAYSGEPSILYHNNGNGTFTDVSIKSKVGTHVGKGMGVAFGDYDGDGFTDLFVSNDTYRNFLYHNKRDGTFEEVGLAAGVAYNQDGKSIAGMGADFRDFDNDGRPDIFVVGMTTDTFPLYRNMGGRSFTEVTDVTGLSRATQRLTGWSTGMYDFDNDGFKDIFTSNGSVLDNAEVVDGLPSRLPNLLLRNLRGHLFQDVSATAGTSFMVPRAHRGAAFGDLNHDGRIDIVTTSLNDRPEILVNRSPQGNHWLLIKLIGQQSNRQGIGAKITVSSATARRQVNHVTTSVGYASSSDALSHFGLGPDRVIETIKVEWPSGAIQILTAVSADQFLTVTEPGKNSRAPVK